MIFFLDKSVQYPSLNSIQNDLKKFHFKHTINNNLTDVQLKIDRNDNYSSEEEIDVQEMAQAQIKRPIFDRSTKVFEVIKVIYFFY